MVIVYVTRIWGENADISYNVAWEGLWIFAEISFGITAACTFSLPKFIEAKGADIRAVFSRITRPFSSITPRGSFGRLPMQLKRDTMNSEEVTLDTVTMVGNSESEQGSINPDFDVERDASSYESDHQTAKYSSDPALKRATPAFLRSPE